VELGSVTLYSKDGCIRCDIVKQMLNNHNVLFDEIKDESIIEEKEYEQLPMMEVDGKEMEYNQILYWMKERGIYGF
jgi:glutaredoxin